MIRCTVNLKIEEYNKLVAAIAAHKGSQKVACQDVLVTDMGATVTVLASTPQALFRIALEAGRALPAAEPSAVPGPAPDNGKEGGGA